MKSIECPSKLPKRLSPESRRVKPELSSERFQHVRFLDCHKAVIRIIFEYWTGTAKRGYFVSLRVSL
ncbi:hypothetical protein [Nostoc sp. LEGE 12450]|uniref:hypothetical protein n=1 Tax=Nostoc sp. LEGE 12450 TaxID=1828643 RepID=UPI0018812554|nr:hypothetical protein [Nostoc sp. LEGE 12450]MBE8992557.1 hypothetical protein [Nostoc sp. LEGE 12450]